MSEDTMTDFAKESMSEDSTMAITKEGTRTSGTARKTMRTRNRAGEQFGEDGTIVNHRIRVLKTLKTPAPVDHRNNLKTARGWRR